MLVPMEDPEQQDSDDVEPDDAWALDGTWEGILTAVLAAADEGNDIGWTVSVDSTVRRAHQHTAGARKRGRQIGLSLTITGSDVPAAA